MTCRSAAVRHNPATTTTADTAKIAATMSGAASLRLAVFVMGVTGASVRSAPARSFGVRKSRGSAAATLQAVALIALGHYYFTETHLAESIGQLL